MWRNNSSFCVLYLHGTTSSLHGRDRQIKRHNKIFADILDKKDHHNGDTKDINL